jgi:hypothetical protein
MAAGTTSSTIFLPTSRPAVFRLPTELLMTVFERLWTRDLAAAVPVCRLWTHVGYTVLWHSPPKALLSQWMRRPIQGE